MSQNVIVVKWAKSEDENVFNFGDDIGPYIISSLSGKKVKNIKFASNRLISIKHLGRKIYGGKFSLDLIKAFFKSFFVKEYILTCGSILQWYSSSRAVVWGSGIIDSNVKLVQAKKYLAVRGKYTEEKISGFTQNKSVVYGDPALLLPLIYNSKPKRKYRLGVIPHYIHYDKFKEQDLPEDVLLINLNSRNIEEVIDNICSCEYTVSTSLHGIIVSHAYGIKSLWYEVKGSPLAGDNVKFYDYFSSVDIPNYQPFSFDDKFNTDEIIENVLSNEDIGYLNVDIKAIHQRLIKCAPFKVKEKFVLQLS